MSPARRRSTEAILLALEGGRTTAQVAAALHCSPALASRRLAALRARGVVEEVIEAPLRLVWQRPAGRPGVRP